MGDIRRKCYEDRAKTHYEVFFVCKSKYTSDRAIKLTTIDQNPCQQHAGKRYPEDSILKVNIRMQQHTIVISSAIWVGLLAAAYMPDKSRTSSSAKCPLP
jgi:hypothetical protein